MRMFALALTLFSGIASALSAACEGSDMRPTLAAETLDKVDAIVAATPFPEGNLWRAEKEGAVIHVLGTLHLGDPRMDPAIARLRPLVENARLLFLEVTSAEQAVMQTDPSLMLLPGSTTLPSLMTEDEWTAVAQALNDRGFPSLMASRIQPFFLASILSIPPCALSQVQANQGVDAQVEAMAQAKGIPTASLETIDEILEIVRNFPLDLQIKMLLGSLYRPDIADDMLETMIASYLAETNADSWAVIRELSRDASLGGGPEFDVIMDEIEARLLVKRNHLWLPRILAEAGPQPIFVAMGAAHLPGKDGVLNLLANEGYALTRLPF